MCGAKIQLNQSFPFETIIEFQMPCALNFWFVQPVFENEKIAIAYFLHYLVE